MTGRTLTARPRAAAETNDLTETSASPEVALATPSLAKGQSLQDQFLNLLRKNKTPVTMFLVKGVKLQGIVTWFDNFSILLRRDGQTQLVYKHAVSTIMPSMPVDVRQFTTGVEGGKKTRLLQDVFLASTRNAGVLLEREGYVQLAYKHAVSTIQPLGHVDLTGEWDGEEDTDS